MRRAFTGFATVLVLAVVAQFFLAAVGAFSSAPTDESFAMHRALGYGILLLAVLATILGAVARLPGRLIGLTGLVAGLTIVQGLISAIANAVGGPGDATTTAGQLIFGLHAVNALAIMGLTGNIVRQARALSTRASAATPAQTAP